MTPQASSGSTTPRAVCFSSADKTRSGIGPLSAELLIVCLDPAEAQTTLAPFLEACGVVLETSQTGEELIPGRITSVMQPLAPQPLALPAELEECSNELCNELQNMHRLRLVLTLGISAHIVVLGACGIPLSRLDFRPGEITHLPDGLLLADGCHFPNQPCPSDILAQRHTILTNLAPKIRAALRPSS